MRNKSISDSFKDSDEKISYQGIIIAFLIVCLVGLTIITKLFNDRIEKHDKELTFEICTLISEKLDSSMQYMSDSVKGCSAMISGTPVKDDPAMIYENFKRGQNQSNMISVGLISHDGVVYADENELKELEKWGLLKAALDDEQMRRAGGVAISTPYRSEKTGQMVFTIFSGAYLHNEKVCTIFMTFSLAKIQEMANTKTIGDETEIWLMNRSSDNYIRCSGPDNAIGGWSNFRLYKNEIKNKNDYRKWETSLREGDEFDAVNYTLNGIDYTQVFKRIDYMPGWNVVVRMPSHSLASMMKPILISIIAFAIVIIGIALALIWYFHEKESEEKEVFEKLSTYDPLTQIMNRRAFDEKAQSLMEKTGRGKFAFMFVDIDYFKQVNDRFGHEAGDRLLTEFSIALRNIFGKCGLAARYGGDEFVVLVKDKSKNEVNRMVEELRTTLGRIIIDDPQSYGMDRFNVQFSAGIASFPDDAKTFSQLLRCADDALYKVKEAGRNGYRWYGE